MSTKVASSRKRLLPHSPDPSFGIADRIPLARLSNPDQVMMMRSPAAASATASRPDGDPTRDLTVSVPDASSSAISSPCQR